MMQGCTNAWNFAQSLLQKGVFAVSLWRSGDRNCPDFIEKTGLFCYAFDGGAWGPCPTASVRRPGGPVGVRVFLAAALAAALLEGGISARADAGVPAWFYTASESGFAAANDTSLSQIQSLSRLAQIDTGGLVLTATSDTLLRRRDFEAAMPFSRNFVVEFGSRSGNAFDLAPDGLFTDPAEWEPFAQTGREMHAEAAVPLGHGLSLNFGESIGESGSLLPDFGPAWMQTPLGGTGRGQGFAGTGFADLSWSATPWASLGLVARSENAAGPAVQPGFAPVKASAQSLGISAKVALGKGWVTSFTYNQGITQLDLRPAGNLLPAEGPQQSRSYGVAIAKHGLFGDDALGFELSRPSPSSLGGVDLSETTAVDPFDGFISSATRPILGGSSQETDVQLGYVTTFLDGALALQANAGYQMNSAGQPGNNGVAVLSRAKINF